MERNRSWARWVFGAALVLMLGLLLLKFFVMDFFTIPQNGMYPGLPAGSRLVCLRHPYRDASEVKRGDVIVFKQAVNGQTYNFIWRVVGLPGDRVEVTGSVVKINQTVLPRQEVRREGGSIIYRETNGQANYEVAYASAGSRLILPTDLIVQPGEFFVLGDNRDAAQDSRYNGTVRLEAIIARKYSR